MVRRQSSEYDWAKMLYEKCMLDRDDADYYASKLVKHHLSITDLPDLTETVLKNVGISRMGHCLAILKYSKEVRRIEAKSRKSISPRKSNHHRSKSVSSFSSNSSFSSAKSTSRSPEKRRHRQLRRSPSPPILPSSRRSNKDKYYYEKSKRARTRSRSPRYKRKSPKRSKSPKKRDKDDSSPKKNKVAHIDRTGKGKTKLTDDDLLGANIELPSRFKSKTKIQSVLKCPGTTGGPKVTRKFKDNPHLTEKLGLDRLALGLTPKDKEDTDNYVYIHKEKVRRYETGKNGQLKIEVSGGTQKFKKALQPPNETLKIDKSLDFIKHKEGRYGKSAGMFSIDDDIRELKSEEKVSRERSRSRDRERKSRDFYEAGRDINRNKVVDRRRLSLQDRLGNKTLNKDIFSYSEHDDRDRGLAKDREDSRIEDRLGPIRNERPKLDKDIFRKRLG